jgi:hypothetical protein
MACSSKTRKKADKVTGQSSASPDRLYGYLFDVSVGDTVTRSPLNGMQVAQLTLP